MAKDFYGQARYFAHIVVETHVTGNLGKSLTFGPLFVSILGTERTNTTQGDVVTNLLDESLPIPWRPLRVVFPWQGSVSSITSGVTGSRPLRAVLGACRQIVVPAAAAAGAAGLVIGVLAATGVTAASAGSSAGTGLRNHVTTLSGTSAPAPLPPTSGRTSSKAVSPGPAAASGATSAAGATPASPPVSGTGRNEVTPSRSATVALSPSATAAAGSLGVSGLPATAGQGQAVGWTTGGTTGLRGVGPSGNGATGASVTGGTGAPVRGGSGGSTLPAGSTSREPGAGERGAGVEPYPQPIGTATNSTIYYATNDGAGAGAGDRAPLGSSASLDSGSGSGSGATSAVSGAGNSGSGETSTGRTGTVRNVSTGTPTDVPMTGSVASGS